ncbi:MAG: helix-turn-helix transcriptional regulator [Thermoleophilia bacterium]
MLKQVPPRTGLEKILRERGTKNTWLAAEIGKTPHTVGTWVRGEVIPGKEDRRRISEILGVDIYNLFFRHEDEPEFLMPTG